MGDYNISIISAEKHSDRVTSYWFPDISADIITLTNNLTINFSALGSTLFISDVSHIEKLNVHIT